MTAPAATRLLTPTRSGHTLTRPMAGGHRARVQLRVRAGVDEAFAEQLKAERPEPDAGVGRHFRAWVARRRSKGTHGRALSLVIVLAALVAAFAFNVSLQPSEQHWSGAVGTVRVAQADCDSKFDIAKLKEMMRQGLG